MGHYYDRDGNPAYEVDGKPTGIVAARKHKLVPSVTEIIAMKANYGIQIYRQNQLLDASIEMAHQMLNDDFDEAKWRKAVVAKSHEHREEAASKGNIIHDALEDAIKGGEVEGDVIDIVNPVLDFLTEKFPKSNWVAEKSFTHNNYGFGGKVDLHDPENSIVLDFKTKGGTDTKKMRQYDDHGMQTAAYAVGLFDAEYLDKQKVKRYNLFISTEVPGLMKLCESKNFDRDWNMFYHLLRFWQYSNRYCPGDYV